MQEKTNFTENSSGSCESRQDEPVEKSRSRASSVDNGTATFFSPKQSNENSNLPAQTKEGGNSVEDNTETIVINIRCCSLF
ncbi:hypothetical protein BN59_02753 [Legionella massiliensis]|uniref:Uncharacterized protein n=1 Tax=Legionella massiliensis TaxID=1034943 RepID=A0A078L3C8_9GAMM|nr:hypothetical protein [Legionella massiliensis]CDZ78443.1 hypothetical protein BN59_02753 [Legionella massiliensis]CEE14181.1 hypothetical protein BN1094_02753 [Legionella massiliensis]